MAALDQIVRIRTPQRVAEDFIPSALFILAGWPAFSNDNAGKESFE